MSPITLIIRPYCSPRTGKRVHGQFDARLDGKLICFSRLPLLDAASVAAADGVDPATPIAVRHEGIAYDALRSTVGLPAELTVEENEGVGPRFARWKAFPRSNVEAPVRFERDPAPDTGGSAERIHALATHEQWGLLRGKAG
jgi:hypothetical protein